MGLFAKLFHNKNYITCGFFHFKHFPMRRWENDEVNVHVQLSLPPKLVTIMKKRD